MLRRNGPVIYNKAVESVLRTEGKDLWKGRSWAGSERERELWTVRVVSWESKKMWHEHGQASQRQRDWNEVEVTNQLQNYYNFRLGFKNELHCSISCAFCCTTCYNKITTRLQLIEQLCNNSATFHKILHHNPQLIEQVEFSLHSTLVNLK